jgi:hypothetical protein
VAPEARERGGGCGLEEFNGGGKVIRQEPAKVDRMSCDRRCRGRQGWVHAGLACDVVVLIESFGIVRMADVTPAAEHRP